MCPLVAMHGGHYILDFAPLISSSKVVLNMLVITIMETDLYGDYQIYSYNHVK